MNALRCSECGAAIRPMPPHLTTTPGTRHYQLVNSNEPPLESDVSSAQSAISEASKHLSSLDDEIRALRIRLKQMEDAHAAVSAYLAQNSSILSPLRRTPPEVLGEIFSWTLPSVLDAFNHGGFEVENSPWVLTHVSRRWRAVALSDPSLWSLIAIDYSMPTRLSMLEVQISRAQNLKIHFHGSEVSESESQTALFQSLAEHSSVWEELSIGLTSHLSPLLSTVRDRIPSLRRLWLECDHSDDSDSQMTVEYIDAFRAAPSLVDVGVLYNQRHIPILIPAHQLTRYQLGGPWAVHQNLLKETQNLIEASITVAFDDGPWPEPGDIVVLPHLRRLCVSPTPILRYLSTPGLQEIAFDFIFDRGDFDLLADIEPFLDRSTCSPPRFCFRGRPDAHEIIAVLQKYPSIPELRIMTCGRNDELVSLYDAASTLISSLTVPNATVPGGATLSPQLTRIAFGCEYETYIDYALYLKMLESRWTANGYTLKSAALLTNEGLMVGSATLEGLHSLRADGLDLLLLRGSAAMDVMDSWIYKPRWT